MPDFDPVERPEHYAKGGVECIHYIEERLGPLFQGYLQGNVIKYLHRYRDKGNPLQDLEKAQWYLTELINYVTVEQMEEDID